MAIDPIDLTLSLPLLILSCGAFLLLFLESLISRPWPRAQLSVVILVAAATALQGVWELSHPRATAFFGTLYTDPYSLFVTFVLIIGTLLALLVAQGSLEQEGIDAPGEYYSLMLMATSGAVIFASAAEMITLFLGLEIMSMALYCLCGSALRMKRSSEAAMKYFFLGSFSSAFLLYGIALLYGLTGTTVIADIAQKLAVSGLPVESSAVAYLGLGLMLVGLIFKIGAVPFHFWAPDVYQGAPTSVTAYMACVIKASAVAAALRVIWSGFRVQEIVQLWSGVIWFVAFLTMIFGNFVALRQRSLKRMLAYSSIGHAGYILVAFLAPSAEYGGGAAILYYLVAYTLMTMGAFGVVLAVSNSESPNDPQADDLSRFYQLGYTNPFLAAMMSIFLLSLAGLPPGMAGLLGKFYVFNAAIKAGYVGLSIVGVLCSAVSCYYYLRVVVVMYFVRDGEKLNYLLSPEGRSPSAATVAQPAFSLAWALRLCAIAVVVLGVFPSLIYSLAAAVMRGF